MTNCHICKKNIGYFETKYNAIDFQGIAEGLTEKDKVCSTCGDNLKSEGKKYHKEENKNYKDKLTRAFLPEWKYIDDSAKHGKEVKCPRCDKVLPAHSLTCLAKQLSNPFYMLNAGQDFAKEVKSAYCPTCKGYLPEHKDGCPLKK